MFERDERATAEQSRTSAHDSRAAAHDSRAAAHDSRAAAHDSPTSAHDSRTAAHDSRTAAHDSRTAAHDSRTAAHDSRTSAHDSPTSAHDSRAAAHDSRTPAHDSRTAAHDSRTQESGAVGRPDTHELLLELAGQLDDDLLAWARELVAVGEEGQAVELVSAALAAERVALPPAVRAAVVAASRAAYTDLDADAELAPTAPDDVPGHRFDAAARSGDRIAAVLAALPARRLTGCTLHLTWRLTPAGAAPGPVPRAVVLVETDRSTEVLGYLLATELDRAGTPASVEVFAAGGALPAYHAAALRSARRIEVGASVIAPAGVVVARTVAETAAGVRPVDPEPADVQTDTAALRVMPAAGDADGPAGEARGTGRRRRREPVAASAEPEPPGDVADDAPDTDPFHDPLRVPLLAPLLDPTTLGVDDRERAAVPTPIRPVPVVDARPENPSPTAAPEVNGPEPVTARPSDQARPVPPVSAAEPAGPDVPGELPQEWEDDWRSGNWAMPPAGLLQPSGSFDVVETPTQSLEENAAEQAARTELPSRTVANRPELPSRTDPEPEQPTPTVAENLGPDLPSRTPRSRQSEQPEGAPPPPGPFGTEGTAAFPSRHSLEGRAGGPMSRRTPAAGRPSDASLFDPPTARVDPLPRSVPAGPVSPPDRPPPGPGDVSLFGEPPRDGRPDGPPPESARPGRRRRRDVDAPEPGPAPPAEAEPSVLNSTERDLLAQLQAELADRERRPRPYRRGRSTVPPAVNDHGANRHGVNGHPSDGPAPGKPGAD